MFFQISFPPPLGQFKPKFTQIMFDRDKFFKGNFDHTWHTASSGKDNSMLFKWKAIFLKLEIMIA